MTTKYRHRLNSDILGLIKSLNRYQRRYLQMIQRHVKPKMIIKKIMRPLNQPDFHAWSSPEPLKEASRLGNLPQKSHQSPRFTNLYDSNFSLVLDYNGPWTHVEIYTSLSNTKMDFDEKDFFFCGEWWYTSIQLQIIVCPQAHILKFNEHLRHVIKNRIINSDLKKTKKVDTCVLVQKWMNKWKKHLKKMDLYVYGIELNHFFSSFLLLSILLKKEKTTA